jgi:4-nitrophenyl phosphatase
MALKDIECLLIDIDGTLFRGNTLLPHVNLFFHFLERHQIKYLVVTNNTKSATTYQQRFANHGISIDKKKILTCVDTVKIYLTQNKWLKTAYVIGKADLITGVKEAGVELVTDGKGHADAVIVGGDFELHYEKLKNAVLHLQKGSQLIGSNGDLLIPTEEGLVPEAGMTLAALVAAVPTKPVVLGKPEKHFFDIAVSLAGSSIRKTAMLGDRLDTDILGAKAAGLKTILICTGVDNEDTVKSKAIFPDYIVADLAELMWQWKNGL